MRAARAEAASGEPPVFSLVWSFKRCINDPSRRGAKPRDAWKIVGRGAKSKGKPVRYRDAIASGLSFALPA